MAEGLPALPRAGLPAWISGCGAVRAMPEAERYRGGKHVGGAGPVDRQTGERHEAGRQGQHAAGRHPATGRSGAGRPG
jgi:hypothetical protein